MLNVELHPYLNVLKTINFVENPQAFCAIKNSKVFYNGNNNNNIIASSSSKVEVIIIIDELFSTT